MGLFDIFNGGAKKAGKAQAKGIQNAMNATTQAYQPYIDRGNTAFNEYNTSLNQMQNPGAFLEQATAGYKPSMGYANRLSKILDVIRNNAAQQGTLGTGAQDREIADYTTGLLDEDLQQYLQNYFGVNNAYLGGKQGIADQGFNASSRMGSGLADLYNQQGQAKAQAIQGQYAPWQSLIGHGVTGAADYAMGGGFGALSKGLTNVISPYSSKGSAELSWLRNGGRK